MIIPKDIDADLEVQRPLHIDFDDAVGPYIPEDSSIPSRGEITDTIGPS
jgi:hypothetical protein